MKLKKDLLAEALRVEGLWDGADYSHEYAISGVDSNGVEYAGDCHCEVNGLVADDGTCHCDDPFAVAYCEGDLRGCAHCHLAEANAVEAKDLVASVIYTIEQGDSIEIAIADAIAAYQLESQFGDAPALKHLSEIAEELDALVAS